MFRRIFEFMILGMFSSVNAAEIRVAASANLSFVMPILIESFQQDTSTTVSLTLGSTRSMSHQIFRGAPFEVFLSADKAAIEHIKQADLNVGASVVYARGQLCIYLGKYVDVDVEITNDLTKLVEALESGLLTNFAIANPETAPYGLAAREVLIKQGLWQQVQAYLVFGESAAQVAQFALSGVVDLALLPCSLTQTQKFQEQGSSLKINTGDYRALTQSMILLKGASAFAQQFFEFMQSDQAQWILQNNAYLKP